MADIGVKIGVDGEKQFKQDLANCTQAGKTLDAQMKALAATFGTAENKEESYSKATKLLSEQVENQQKKVDMLSKAVEESSKQFGENSTKTLKLKEQLAKAETELSKLENTSTDSAIGLKELAQEEKAAGNEANSAGEKTSAWAVALGQLAADAIKQGFQFMVDSLKSIVGYFKDATTGAAAYADEIMSLSSVTGLSTDALQEYKYMAALTDTEVSTITGSLTKLTAKMSSAQDGSASAVAAFDSLGISVTNADGSLRSADDVFQEAITALGSISNETERDALAMDIFGKSAKELNPLIEAGGEAIAGFRQEAQDMGAVLDEDTLTKLSAVQDGFDRLGLAADSVKTQVGAAIGEFILPYLQQLVAAIQMLIGGGDVDAFISQISEMLNGLLNEFANALPVILQVGGEIVGKLIMGINDMLPDLVPVAVDLITQFATFIISNLPTIVATAVDIIIALIDGLGNAMPKLIPAAIQAIITIVKGLTSRVGDIVRAALTLIGGLVEGLTSKDGILSIIDAIPTIIQGIITGIIENLPQIIAAGVSIIGNLVVGLIQAIPTLLGSTQEIITAIINAFKNTDWSAFGKQMIDNVGNGIKSMWTNIKQVAIDTWEKIKAGFQVGIDTISNIGENLVQGLWNGINDAKEWILSKIKGFCDSITSGIKSFFGIQSPSKVMENSVGKWLARGIVKGVEDEQANTIQELTKSLDSTLDEIYKELDKKRSELNEKLNKKLEKLSKERTELEKKLSAASTAEQAKSLRKKIKEVDSQIKEAKKESREAILEIESQYDKKIEDERKKTSEKIIKEQEAFDDSIISSAKSRIEHLKKLDKISVVQELDYWQEVIGSVKKGSDAYKEASEQIYSIKKSLRSSIASVTKSYVDGVAKVNTDLDKNIASLKDAYAKTVESRKNSIVSSLSLFDNVKIDEALTKQQLEENLRNQVSALREWDNVLTRLQKRLGKDSPLLKELQGMGVSALGTLTTLDSMSKKELSSYAELYAQKLEIASGRAETESADLLKQTDKQIAALEKKASKQVKALEKTYITDLKTLGISVEGESESIGKQITAGISLGFKDGSSGLAKGLKKEIKSMIQAIKEELGIASPSKVFANQIGKWLPLGIAQGFASAIPQAENSILSSIDSMVSGVKTNVFDDVSSSGAVTNVGGVNIVVNAKDGQNANDIANIVMQKMQAAVNSRKAVFA